MKINPTNQYRKCPNCPHHPNNHPKCCCQKSSLSTLRSRAITSRAKKQQNCIKTVKTWKQNESGLNTTSPIPTIMYENSILKNENHQLKKELMNVSAFLKDDLQTYTQSNTNDSYYQEVNISLPQLTLSEKLFQANKNYKDSLSKIELLAKQNHSLQERNSSLATSNSILESQNCTLTQEAENYKKKWKKYYRLHQANKENQPHLANTHFNQLPQKGDWLEMRCRRLEEENLLLRNQIQINTNMDSDAMPKINTNQTMSPGWLASTNSKLLRMENNVVRIQENIYQPDQELQSFKRMLTDSINQVKTLKMQDSFKGAEQTEFNMDVSQLVECLLGNVVDHLFAHCLLLHKEMHRKVTSHQRKISQLTSKMENLMLSLKNKHLRHRITNTFQQPRNRERHMN